MLDKKVTEYVEKFNEPYPIFMLQGEDHVQVIDKCIELNVPALTLIDVEDDVDY